MLHKISLSQAERIIEEYGLQIYNQIWHYSFDVTINRKPFVFAKNECNEMLIYKESYNSHSPVLCYCNKRWETQKVKIDNFIDSKYVKENKENRKIFWYLRIGSFDDYLMKRTKMSDKPRKHFPTSLNYGIIEEKISGSFSIEQFNRSDFIEFYDRLKVKSHIDGASLLSILTESHPFLPVDYLRIGYLRRKGDVKAVALIIDDGKSLSLYNIASERSTLSYGVFLCTKLIQYCCINKYYSFDAGISGIYGTYKDKIFLDSFEVFSKKASMFSKIRKRISLWMKNIFV
jgi:hypothetical protein